MQMVNIQTSLLSILWVADQLNNVRDFCVSKHNKIVVKYYPECLSVHQQNKLFVTASLQLNYEHIIHLTNKVEYFQSSHRNY